MKSRDKWLWIMVIVNISIVVFSISVNIITKNYSALTAWINTILWILITAALQKRMYKQQDAISSVWSENIDMLLARFKIEEIQKWLRKKKLENLKNKEHE
jgi:putative effector of murein hydrolase